MKRQLIAGMLGVSLILASSTFAMASSIVETQAVSLPFGVVLNPATSTPNAHGAAVFFSIKEKFIPTLDEYGQKTAFSIVAHRLPAPSSFGDYDTYEGLAQIPGRISWRVGLVPSLYFPPRANPKEITPDPKEYTWAGTFVGISTPLTKETKVQVRLSNSKTDSLGPAVLEGTLKACN